MERARHWFSSTPGQVVVISLVDLLIQSIATKIFLVVIDDKTLRSIFIGTTWFILLIGMFVLALALVRSRSASPLDATSDTGMKPELDSAARYINERTFGELDELRTERESLSQRVKTAEASLSDERTQRWKRENELRIATDERDRLKDQNERLAGHLAETMVENANQSQTIEATAAKAAWADGLIRLETSMPHLDQVHVEMASVNELSGNPPFFELIASVRYVGILKLTIAVDRLERFTFRNREFSQPPTIVSPDLPITILGPAYVEVRLRQMVDARKDEVLEALGEPRTGVSHVVFGAPRTAIMLRFSNPYDNSHITDIPLVRDGFEAELKWAPQ